MSVLLSFFKFIIDFYPLYERMQWYFVDICHLINQMRFVMRAKESSLNKTRI